MCVREKPRSEVEMVTVPKLTQVGGLKIPRRSREPSLRNSANLPRNFGIRGAHMYVKAFAAGAEMGCNKEGVATVY